MSTATMPARDLIRAIQATSKAMGKFPEKERLHGLFFDLGLGSLNIVATNGHWLAKWTETLNPGDVSDEKHGDFYVDGRCLKTVIAWLKALPKTDSVTVDLTAGSLQAGTQVLGLQENYETFPTYHLVIPAENREETIGRIGMAAQYISVIGAAFKSAGGAETAMTLAFGGELDPISIRADSVPELHCVLMPTRLKAPVETEAKLRRVV